MHTFSKVWCESGVSVARQYACPQALALCCQLMSSDDEKIRFVWGAKLRFSRFSAWADRGGHGKTESLLIEQGKPSNRFITFTYTIDDYTGGWNFSNMFLAFAKETKECMSRTLCTCFVQDIRCLPHDLPKAAELRHVRHQRWRPLEHFGSTAAGGTLPERGWGWDGWQVGHFAENGETEMQYSSTSQRFF